MRVITFGELMLRLAPNGYLRFVQSDNLEATFGGAEANVAVSLANFGEDASFVTKLPDHEIGQAGINSLRKFGVDTSRIVRGGDRVGIYFCEKGASQRPSKVVYDRAGSSVATAKKEDFDWNKIFDGADWFHFTGITPALSSDLAQITLQAVKEAKKRGITVSFDLNFRSKLWTAEEAGKVVNGLLGYCDFVFGVGVDEARNVLGLNVGQDGENALVEIAEKLTEKYNVKGYAITLREGISASDNNIKGMFYTDGKAYYSKKYAMHIVDRVGGGDGFGAGLIYSVANGFDAQKTVEFATAASCLKHTVEGDYNMVSVKEVEALALKDSSGRVQR